MKTVLIISYYFPPCNLTASQRAFGWANHFKESNYNPIVLTRNWENEINAPLDVHRKSGTIIEYVENDKYSKVILPKTESVYDKLIINNNKFLKIIQKFITIYKKFIIHFSSNTIPYSDFQSEAKKILRKNNISGIIITGAPFEMFKIGYLLNKEFNIPWIADYRDDWSTNEVLKYNLIEKTLNKLIKKSEKKWINSASAITSISSHYTRKISNFVNKPGYVIENGFSYDYKLPNLTSKTFTIIYNGTLYGSQPIEVFIEAFIEFSKNKKNVELKFIGAGYDPDQKIRLEKYKKQLGEKLIITSRIEREKILIEQSKAALLLMFSHLNCKGIPSSKLYEYFSFGKNILCYPNDYDILNEKLSEYELGLMCDSKSDIICSLNKLYIDFTNDKLMKIENIENNEFIIKHSRKNQVKLITNICDKYF